MAGSSSTPQKGGGIYRNLMMPGFADAGAGTAYVPNTVIPRRTAAAGNSSTGSRTAASVEASSNANIQTTTDTSSHAEETFSEAGTELHDNRTNKNSLHSMANGDRDRYYLFKTSVVPDGGKSERGHDGRSNTISNNIKNFHNDNQANNTSNESTEVETNFGFFPSTRPPPSPSPRGNAGTLAAGGTPKRGTRQQPTPPSPNPQPHSPPPVTRKQLVAAKSIDATDSNASQKTPKASTKAITTLSPTIEEQPNDQGDSDGNEPKTQLALHEQSVPMQRGMMKREVSTFSLAPETGAVVETEESQAELKQWKEREALHQQIDEENEIESDGDNSPNDTKALSETATRRLDLNALQEIDRIQGQKQSKDSDELSTSSSIVSSTCSEFGTVIQLGEAAMAARMKEVEEMELAALAEVPSEEQDSEHQNKQTAPQLSSTFLLQHDNSSGKIETANKNSDAKTTVAKANSTVSPMRNPTKSEMVSAAFRRIGPLHSLNSGTALRGDKKVRNSSSAPTTPMRVHTFDHSKQAVGNAAEGQKPSPSRFETASDVAGDNNTRMLSPRFASFLRARGHGDTTSSSTNPKPTTKSKPAPQLSPRVAISQTFQYAQKCFANDKTLIENGSNDDVSDFDYYDPDERRRQLQEDLVIPPLGGRPTTARLAPRVLPLESSSFIRGRRGVNNSLAGIRPSQSLDYSSSRRSPFRELPASISQQRPFVNHSFPAPPKEDTTSIPTSANINLRDAINSDFSPSKITRQAMSLNSTMELHQPQRIEIEREDALDILACLVEQGIADWNTGTKIENIDPGSINQNDKVVGENVDNEDSSPDILETAKEEKTEEAQSSKEKPELDDIFDSNHLDPDVQDLVGVFNKWIENEDKEGKGTKTKKRHQRQRRTKILQDLIKSHAYAVDMKRASVSASTWLKSIGRGQGTSKQEPIVSVEEREDDKPAKLPKDVKSVDTDKTDEITDKMEMLTLKATLHSAQLELTETREQNSRLNEELSKCRAEIGRIKSISRTDRISKSILDDSSEGSAIETRSKGSLAAEAHTKDATKTDQTYESFVQGASSNEERESFGESDVMALINALNKANDNIRRLHSDLRRKEGSDDKEGTDPAPIVDIPEIQANNILSRSTDSTQDSTLRTVNVHMLDGENFVTEWNDLKALPPPPDHSLQSPIVSAILEQWTQDRSLHDSLFVWIDNVMKGDDLEDLPPLSIHDLDHQVRDGFIMHVLPHLLRRADIHVAVKTRSHRLTKYDMSVTVSQKKEGMTRMNSPQQFSLLDRRDSVSGDEWADRFEPRFSSAESVAHSAVTEAIANHSSAKHNQQGLINDTWDQPPQTPVQTEYSEFSSQYRPRSGSPVAFEESSQQYRQRQSDQNQGTANGGTIMGALGGALTGLLSRNKYAASPSRSQTQVLSTGSLEDSRNVPNMLPASLRAQMDLTSSPTPGSKGYHRMGQVEATLPATIDSQQQHNEEEPYHRVVSAPPGRIGMTFVEFRGHAMVSDVAADSPLAGWVFPSDVLIAIDEIPVSGMRVRDIVAIIADRKQRQRALRVMSSHDMNEFTMMSQVGGPLNEEAGEDE